MDTAPLSEAHHASGEPLPDKAPPDEGDDPPKAQMDAEVPRRPAGKAALRLRMLLDHLQEERRHMKDPDGAKRGAQMAAIAMLVWWVRKLMLRYTSITFGWMFEPLLHLWLPFLLFYLYRKGKLPMPPGSEPNDSGPLAFLADAKLRAGAVMVLLPAMGWLMWDMRKRMFAQEGPMTNATIGAIFSSKDFLKSLVNLLLLPLVSFVAAAHHAGDHRRLLQVIATGLGIALLGGALLQIAIFTSAEYFLSYFQGAQALHPSAPTLMRIYCADFACDVVKDASMAILAGSNQHMLIGECVLFPLLLSFGSTVYFRSMGMSLRGLLFSMAAHNFLVFIIIVRLVWATVSRARKALGQPAPAAGTEGSAPLVTNGADVQESSIREKVLLLARDVAPSKEVFREMLQATGNTGIRNMALRLKDLLTGMFATQLGNLEGSSYGLQMMLGAYMSGPAGAVGFVTANIAPAMLKASAYRLFLATAGGVLGLYFFAASIWFHFAARGGPQHVLRYGGIYAMANATLNLTNLTADLTASCDASMNASMGNFTASGVLGGASCNASTNGTFANSTGDLIQDYMNVLTPLNHWLWVASTICNEVAAPFDGFVMVLGAYNSMGMIYTLSFLGFLPVLALAKRASLRGTCLLPNFLLELIGFAGHCNAYTGVVFTTFVWSVLRFSTALFIVFRVEGARLMRLGESMSDACTTDVVLGYVESRNQLPLEEIDAYKEKASQNRINRWLPGQPLDLWAQEHKTSVEAMTLKFIELQASRVTADSDPGVRRAIQTYRGLYGEWM